MISERLTVWTVLYRILKEIYRYFTAAFALIGHQKGRTTKANLARNFGMPRPEGYRKAQRVMLLAERFNLPIVTSLIVHLK